ncbi:MAG TPA: hypothetical protein VFR73_06590 [Hyphomicrobiaceae bacterium]|nr:hypothetical protein [Hyphomicrobiaceae bacterium]
MRNMVRGSVSVLALGLTAGALVASAAAQTAGRDRIGELLNRAPDAGTQMAQSQSGGQKAAPGTPAASSTKPAPPDKQAAAEKDVREGDPSFEQAQRLMKAVDAILQDTAKNRGEAKKLPSEGDFLMKPLWTETREDREKKIRDLLDAAMGIVTDVPVVDVQRKIESLRKNIRDLDDRIVTLREKQLTAPKDGVLPGYITDTVDSLGKDIEESKKRIEGNREEIAKAKAEVHAALNKAGIQLAPEQVDLLLDSVLSGDLVRLVAVFNSAKLIDGQLARLMTVSGENIGAARKYFAMHAALFALLVHAQDMLVGKIDKQYLPKLSAIEQDIRVARNKTAELLRAENREDQKRVLESNRESQKLAEDAAKGYRRYLLQQREQIAKARQRATHDLKIADNTFETVEASYQLRNLMKDSSSSFEAIQKLEAPTFDQIFKNEELRREFENLTRKLDGPTS